LVSDAKTEEAELRLDALTKTEDGFEIAQEDLNIRGPGELFGKRQHGLPGLALGNVIRDVEILEEARREAFDLISKDPQLDEDRHGGLKSDLKKKFQDSFHLSFMG